MYLLYAYYMFCWLKKKSMNILLRAYSATNISLLIKNNISITSVLFHLKKLLIPKVKICCTCITFRLEFLIIVFFFFNYITIKLKKGLSVKVEEILLYLYLQLYG